MNIIEMANAAALERDLENERERIRQEQEIEVRSLRQKRLQRSIERRAHNATIALWLALGSIAVVCVLYGIMLEVL